MGKRRAYVWSLLVWSAFGVYLLACRIIEYPTVLLFSHLYIHLLRFGSIMFTFSMKYVIWRGKDHSLRFFSFFFLVKEALQIYI